MLEYAQQGCTALHVPFFLSAAFTVTRAIAVAAAAESFVGVGRVQQQGQ